MVAGKVCTKNIFLLAVKVPYKPAMAMHSKKNRAMFVCQIASEMKKVQIKPAAKKPLYKP